MKKILLLFGFLRVFVPAHSQEKRILGFTYYSTEQGLGSSNVHKIKVDKHGFAWIATQDGLYRFDGNRFVTYNKTEEKKHRIAGTDLKDMVFQNDTLWVITSYGGINGINTSTGNVFFELDQQQEKKLDHVLLNSLILQGNELYIGSDRGLFIFNIKDQRLGSISLQAGPDPNPNIYKIIKKKDLLWIFQPTKGISTWNMTTKKITDFFPSDIPYYYDCDQTSTDIVAATSKGLYKFRLVNNKITIIPFSKFIPPTITGSISLSVAVEKNNSIWFSTNQQVFRIDSSERFYEKIKPGKIAQLKDWTQSVYGIYLDNENNIWLSTQEGMAFAAIQNASLIAYQKSSESNTIIHHAYTLFPDSDTTIYVCAEDGLYHVNMNSFVITAEQAGKAYLYAFRNFDSSIVVSNENNTFLKKGNTLVSFQKIYPEFRQYDPLLLNSFIRINDTCYVLGSQNELGIFQWNPLSHRVRQINASSYPLKLPDNDINTIKKLNDSTCLVLAANSISLFQPARSTCKELVIKNPVDKRKYMLFFDIEKVKNNFFLSSYGNGILVLDTNFNLEKNITTKEGLANNSVYKIFNYHDSLVFATTNNGLSQINPSTWFIRNYYSKDGVHSNIFEELSGAQKNNIIYAGGGDGFTAIYPDRLHNTNASSKIFFTGIIKNEGQGSTDTSDLNLSRYIISNKTKQVTIYYTALNFSNPENIEYFYRIPEIQDEWLPNHQQNYITLTGFKPGSYRLQVMAVNPDGIKSNYKELTLIFLPKWYQTWWFKIFLVLLIIAAGYGLYRLRISQIRKVEKIRNQLAGDLHDDLGSTLNSVKVYSNLALMEKENTGHLLKIKESTQDAIAGVRDLIWVLDDKKDSVQDLFSRISQFAAPLCEANHIKFEHQVDDSLYHHKLEKEEKRNLYMLLKESINNSIKYAGCNQIMLKAGTEMKKTRITITDDGAGFDKEKIKEGNGLKNISKRAKEIGYKSSIHSSIGNGTVIILVKN